MGDQLLGSGLARGAAAKGRPIAFGNGRRIIWDHNSEQIFRDNPNIAPPGSEHKLEVKWIPFYKGSRIYNRHDKARDRWMWNREFKAVPGEVFFSPAEIEAGRRLGAGFVVIEPHVETWKSVAPNKDWGRDRYQAVADKLIADGHRLVQFVYDKGGVPLAGVKPVRTASFRDALAIMANAKLYLGPEGGLHHGAAAVGIEAVVLFGGFVPPEVTGYRNHANLTGGAEACGSIQPCAHCRAALDAISIDEVYTAAKGRL